MSTIELCERVQKLDRLYLEADAAMRRWWQCPSRDPKEIKRHQRTVRRKWRRYEKLVEEWSQS